jgi:hypothetical protein
MILIEFTSSAYADSITLFPLQSHLSFQNHQSFCTDQRALLTVVVILFHLNILRNIFQAFMMFTEHFNLAFLSRLWGPGKVDWAKDTTLKCCWCLPSIWILSRYFINILVFSNKEAKALVHMLYTWYQLLLLLLLPIAAIICWCYY